MPFLQTVNLEQRAGQARLLKRVNLAVEKGELFVIIGPTGSGKTTLLRLLNLLDRPYCGDIFFDGENVVKTADMPVKARRRMSMVFQKPIVFSGSVLDNVVYPLKVRAAGGTEACGLASEMLETVGLKGYSTRKAKTLSGGEVQRVALARAMVTAPRLLLLDEPTANLDPASASLIEELVLKFNRERGVTVILTTHDMIQGQRLAQRAGVLMQGELIQTGKPLEIFHSPEDMRVASFVGIKNILSGLIVTSEGGVAGVNVAGRTIYCVSDLTEGSPVDIYIRPDDIVLSAEMPGGSARNSLSATIRSLVYTGALCAAQLDCGFTLEALVTSRSAAEMGLGEGQNINISFKATAVKILKRADS